MIKVKNLSKTYNGVTALADISFEAKKGKVIGFLGPNGAGKTTTMKILTGVLSADSGKVTYSGDELAKNEKDIKQHLGYLPEENPLYNNLRVDEFLEFFANLKGNVTTEEVSEIIKKCGLGEVTTKVIDTLSKGYKQRVGLAQAMLGNPKYILLDEPTTGLDPNQKQEILHLIQSAKKDNVIIFSSHVLSEVTQIADEIIIINKGRVVASGKTTDLIKKYLDSATVTIKTTAKAKDFKQFLDTLPGSSDYKEHKESSKLNIFSFSIPQPEEATLKIFKESVKKNWDLVEMRIDNQGLDELFKQLTTNE